MKRNLQLCFLLCAAYGGLQSELIAADRYVSPVGAHLSPFTDWASAATNIQAAIDVSAAGDKVWVTNGLYDTGGRIVAGGSLSNRVALTTAVTVQSVNGPEATIIAGERTPVITNGPASVRCAWLTNGATLSGFTLTNGATLGLASDYYGGGAYCRAVSATLTNCIFRGNSAAGGGGGVYQGTVRGCVILSNTAAQGGGAYNAWLSGCTVSGNRATSGGGVYCPSNQVTISNSTLAGNSASSSGGGAYQGSLQGCLVQSNRAQQGGGTYQAFLCNCILEENAANSGGGAYSSFLTNCAVLWNQATNAGGGAYASASSGRLQNCTVVENQAPTGAGIAGGSAVNSVICSNTAFGSMANYSGAALTNCCTSPVYGPPSANVIDADPLLSSDGIHLQAGSPCIGRGASAWANGVDIDGQTWSTPPAIGCDEWNPQPLIVSQPRVLPGDIPGQARITVELAGIPSSCWWSKDGVPIENDPHYGDSHTRALVVEGFNVGDAGVYQVMASNALGVVTSALVTVTVACVDAASLSPAAPYGDWSKAAQTIQDAVDAAQPGTVVLVTNGLYNSGGRYVAGDMTNRVVLDKALTMLSMNGPEQTIIEGAWDPAATNGPASVRCAWVAEGAVLGGFTLRGGSATFDGGGIWSSGLGLVETAVGCVITNCRARNYGGGAYQGRLRACSLQGNVADSGGGIANAVADHCTLALNSAGRGGGAYQGITTGSVVIGNTSSQGGGVYGGQVWSCLIATNNGDGARSASVRNCRLLKNTGSGATLSTVQGSLFMGNAPYGASASTNLNCTFVGNDTAVNGGVGTNCIVWFNSHPSISGNKAFCLLEPDEQQFTSVTSDRWLFPNLLSDGIHIASDSPAIGHSATIPMLSPVDIDGQPWGNPPAIGCDEWNPQPLIVSQPRVLPGDSPGQALATIELAGLASSCWWTKDGLPVEDGPHYSGARTSALVVQGFNVGDAGVYQVVASNTFGVVTSALVTVTVTCVDAASLSPAAPYDGWSRAARSIQEAVDAAQPGTVVLVTNGLYNSGGRYVAGDMTNRVVLDKALTLLSMNGPEQTVIEGAWDPATTNGPASVRCAWVAEGAVLGGFTLRDGSTPLNGGGIWSPGLGLVETTVGCVVTNCRAGGNGGGAYQGRLRDCIITGNSAGTNGGGTAMAVVDKCLLQANSANNGGGLNGGVARQCRILGNTASVWGGGASGQSSLLGCAVALNQAGGGGGAYNSLLYHCTVVSNLSSIGLTAGIDTCGAWNSIVYFNHAPPDTRYGGLFENVGGDLRICQSICYSPSRVLFLNSITNNPQLLDLWHLAATSPCRGAGTNLLPVGCADIDDQNWNSPPAIGCDEVDDSALTGPLSLSVAGWPEVAVGGVLPLAASITGQAARLEWSFGDGTFAADVGFSTTHRWTNAGSYTVTATVFNSDHPAGVAATLPVNVVPLSSPVLTAPRFSQPTFSVQFTGQPGLAYDIQQATNLTAPIAWQTLQTVNSTGGVITVTDLQATGQYLFYRVQSR